MFIKKKKKKTKPKRKDVSKVDFDKYQSNTRMELAALELAGISKASADAEGMTLRLNASAVMALTGVLTAQGLREQLGEDEHDRFWEGLYEHLPEGMKAELPTEAECRAQFIKLATLLAMQLAVAATGACGVSAEETFQGLSINHREHIEATPDPDADLNDEWTNLNPDEL